MLSDGNPVCCLRKTWNVILLCMSACRSYLMKAFNANLRSRPQTIPAWLWSRQTRFTSYHLFVIQTPSDRRTVSAVNKEGKQACFFPSETSRAPITVSYHTNCLFFYRTSPHSSTHSLSHRVVNKNLQWSSKLLCPSNYQVLRLLLFGLIKEQ